MFLEKLQVIVVELNTSSNDYSPVKVSSFCNRDKVMFIYPTVSSELRGTKVLVAPCEIIDCFKDSRLSTLIETNKGMNRIPGEHVEVQSQFANPFEVLDFEVCVAHWLLLWSQAECDVTAIVASLQGPNLLDWGLPLALLW